jgi:copper homeostasis protein
MVLEVVVETWEDAQAAEAGGADQIEVKCDYLEYGLTPSWGMLKTIAASVDCDVLCMIRPHARSHVYSEHDLAAMEGDIRLAKELPIQGFLVGCLTPEGELDVSALRRLKAAADPLDLHGHLAWEQTRDTFKALDQLGELGFRSLRTSGGDEISGQALDNVDRIKLYAERAAEGMDLFLAGGVRLENLSRLVAKTGITHIHSGSGVREPETRTGSVKGEKVRDMKEILSRYVDSSSEH